MAEQLDIFGPRDADVVHGPHHCTTCGRKGHNARKCPDDKPSIDQRWAEFHQANPHIMTELLRLAIARLDRGDRRIGVKALWEELRSWLRVTGASDYKLNNDFTAPASRMLVELEPRLAGVIEQRTRKAKP